MKVIALFLILVAPIEARTIVFGPVGCSGNVCRNLADIDDGPRRPMADLESITIDKIYGRVTVKVDGVTYITRGMLQDIPEGDLNVLSIYSAGGEESTVTFSYRALQAPAVDSNRGHIFRLQLEYCKIEIPDSRKP